ncbi:MAG: HAMP domain-containing sensor histidine kinase [Planctomycetota bacterium]|nr:HAMP domain-containing sensor histidine kinase [Planctomycetota bacterium]
MRTAHRARWPLSVVIPLLAAVNFLLVLAICLALIGLPLGRGSDEVLLRPVSDRAAAIAGDIDSGLVMFPVEDWDQLLDSESQRLGVTLTLIEPNGRLVAGPDLALSEEVSRIAQLRRMGPGGGDGFGPRDRGGGERVFIVRPPPTGQPVICVRVPIQADIGRPPRPGLLLIVASGELQLARLAGLHWYLLGGVGLLLLSMLLWWPLVRRLRIDLHALGETAASIAAGNFISTPPSKSPRELAELATRIDEMSARLAHLVDGQKRFVADVAHELCSPLARLQMAMGILEERVGEEPCADLRGEADQLSELVQELLMFSKAATGLPARLEPVLLGELVQKVIARERGEAAVVVEINPSICVNASASLLSRAVANLVRNAVRYAGDAGPVKVIASGTSSDRVQLRVVDQGPGVPESALAHLGDPFFRPEAARTRETGGNGLGLAIVKSCAKACGGEVSFRNIASEGGCVGFEAMLTLRTHV